jgi:hypothetical protein
MAAIENLRAMARRGELANTFAAAGGAEVRRLTAAAMTVAGPIVFSRITRAVEIQRGHRQCAVGLHRLSDSCLDRFHDDLDAVVDDLKRTNVAVHNLEGWITRRLIPATVDGHRRRLGARGCLQRPERLPRWLVEGVHRDVWLCSLATEMLTWVGVPATAGMAVWPLNGWVEKRIAVLGDIEGSTAPVVQREVSRVLSVMRTKPQWYATHVERPLSMKIPPLAPAGLGWNAVAEPPAFTLTGPHDVYEAMLNEMAAACLETILARAAAPGFDPQRELEPVVRSVVLTTFANVDRCWDLAEPPHTVGLHERVPSLIDDPVRLANIIWVVRDVTAKGLPPRP